MANFVDTQVISFFALATFLLRHALTQLGKQIFFSGQIVLHAALLVDDASYRRKYNCKPDLPSLQRYQLYHQPWVLTFLRVVALTHLCLAFFEGVCVHNISFCPCRYQPRLTSFYPQYPDHASIPIFPKWATSFIEVLILAVYVVDMLFKRSFLVRGSRKNRKSAWLSDNNYYITWGAIVLTFIDIALGLILRVGWADVKYVRWSVFFRVWFTVYFFTDVRHYFKNLRRTLPEIGHVFAVFFGFIFFFVLIIMTLVQDGGGDEKYAALQAHPRSFREDSRLFHSGSMSISSTLSARSSPCTFCQRLPTFPTFSFVLIESARCSRWFSSSIVF